MPTEVGPNDSPLLLPSSFHPWLAFPLRRAVGGRREEEKKVLFFLPRRSVLASKEEEEEEGIKGRKWVLNQRLLFLLLLQPKKGPSSSQSAPDIG